MPNIISASIVNLHADTALVDGLNSQQATTNTTSNYGSRRWLTTQLFLKRKGNAPDTYGAPQRFAMCAGTEFNLNCTHDEAMLPRHMPPPIEHPHAPSRVGMGFFKHGMVTELDGSDISAGIVTRQVKDGFIVDVYDDTALLSYTPEQVHKFTTKPFEFP